jgi:hypothetical protein
MIETLTKHLLFHGAIVLMIGILTGLVFWFVIIQRKNHEIVRAWRVTHTVLITDGLMMLIAVLVVPHLVLNELSIQILVISLILSGYGFVFAFIIGALKGIRGLIPLPLGLNTILFMGHFIGATGSFIGMALLILGLFRALYA